MAQKKPERSTSRPATVQHKGVVPPSEGAALAGLVERVVAIIEDARTRVVRAVNSEMVLAYWHIGREIVEFVQRGEARAEYGEQVIEGLSAHLQEAVGRGYSVANLRYIRLFYLQFRTRQPRILHEPRDESEVEADPGPKRHGARDEFETQGFSGRLSWTHYRTLTKVEDPSVRDFNEIEAAREGWSVPHLERQIHTHLHLRLMKSRDKEGVRALAREGQVVERPIDLIKSPVVLDFLDLPDGAALRCARAISRQPSSASCRISFSSWAKVSPLSPGKNGSPSKTRSSTSTSSSTTSSSSATCSSI